MIDRSNHVIVPAHKLMTEKEVKELLDKLDVRLDNLPKIFETDPQVQILNGKIGQVVKIERTEGGVKVPYYRFIVDG